jgi:S-adenosylmethionine:tRNA ribosyltransferase-isomerase
MDTPQDSGQETVSFPLSDFDYELPAERIAQTPLETRDDSRLLAVDRSGGSLSHRRFSELPDMLMPGDVLVLNDTRVSALRLFGARHDHPNERVETFLTHRVTDGLWQALVRPGKKLLPGVRVEYGDGLSAEVLERTDDRGGRLLRFILNGPGLMDDALAAHGSAPLPPYITTPLPPEDRERYQTVYAAEEGSAAAPTAGLHFTSELLGRLEAKGVKTARVTLHVGLGTFRPIESEDITAHRMHAERFSVSAEAAKIVNEARGRVVAVGTTSLRTLESAAVGPAQIAAAEGETSLYITPGYRFQVVEALITNFHMPRSTLMVLVSVFAGRELIQRAYQEALASEYRFLSFGDAMFLI